MDELEVGDMVITNNADELFYYTFLITLKQPGKNKKN